MLKVRENGIMMTSKDKMFHFILLKYSTHISSAAAMRSEDTSTAARMRWRMTLQMSRRRASSQSASFEASDACGVCALGVCAFGVCGASVASIASMSCFEVSLALNSALCVCRRHVRRMMLHPNKMIAGSMKYFWSFSCDNKLPTYKPPPICTLEMYRLEVAKKSQQRRMH